MVEAAGFIIFVRKPLSFLLLKHKDRWDLPKGHAEAGETILETALRETQEETGIDPKNLEVDPDFQWELEYSVESKKRGSYEKRVTYFLGFVSDRPDLTLTEHLGFEWFTWPPRSIQSQTIDPLLAAVADHFRLEAS